MGPVAEASSQLALSGWLLAKSRAPAADLDRASADLDSRSGSTEGGAEGCLSPRAGIEISKQ